MGHADGPLDYPPPAFLPDPRSGRFDDPQKEYRTLYCARHQRVALREALQQFRHSTATLSRLKSLFGDRGIRPPRVPDDWRSAHVLAPARIRLAPGSGLASYEDPGQLRLVEEGFAESLESHAVLSLDIPALRSKNRAVSQLLGRFFYERGHGGIVFQTGLPPGGVCVALFEGRAWLEPAGSPRSLTEAFPALRTVCKELALALS